MGGPPRTQGWRRRSVHGLHVQVQKLVKHWSNTVQILVKILSNYGQTLVKKSKNHFYCRQTTVGAEMVVTTDSNYNLKERAVEAAVLTKELAATLKSGIDFEDGKANVTETGKLILDNAAKLLLQYKDYNLAVMIEGHTCCHCKDDCKRVSLSDNRCATVVKYLKVRSLELPAVSRRNLTALCFVSLAGSRLQKQFQLQGLRLQAPRCSGQKAGHHHRLRANQPAAGVKKAQDQVGRQSVRSSRRWPNRR